MRFLIIEFESNHRILIAVFNYCLNFCNKLCGRERQKTNKNNELLNYDNCR